MDIGARRTDPPPLQPRQIACLVESEDKTRALDVLSRLEKTLYRSPGNKPTLASAMAMYALLYGVLVDPEGLRLLPKFIRLQADASPGSPFVSVLVLMTNMTVKNAKYEVAYVILNTVLPLSPRFATCAPALPWMHQRLHALVFRLPRLPPNLPVPLPGPDVTIPRHATLLDDKPLVSSIGTWRRIERRGGPDCSLVS